MEFSELIKKRYAVKNFTGEKISSEDFEKIKEAIRLAPSSFNLQPWKIKIVEDKNILIKLQEAAWNQPQVGSASHLLVFCATSDLEGILEGVLKIMKEKNTPEEKIQGFKNMVEGYLKNLSNDKKYQFSREGIFAALENALLSSFDLGYGSCPMQGFDSVKFKKILNLPDDLDPVVICPIGIPSDKSVPKLRLSKENIFF